MSYYVKPTSDIYIKYLLGREENKSILLAFLNAVLQKSDFDTIVSVEILNPFNIKEFFNDKETILDVKAKDEKGKIYDIEVQSLSNHLFVYRSLYYWSTLYSSQLLQGELYHLLKPTICINILDFELFHEIPDYYSCFLLKERLSNKILTDHLVIYYLELEKLINVVPEDKLESILYYLKNEGKEGDIMLETLIKNDPILEKAHNEYEKFTKDAEMRELYESRMKYQRDKNTMIYEARLEGQLEGKIEDAKNLKNLGVDMKIISKATGLSEKEIEIL